MAEDPRDTQDISAVSWWFDYKLKEKSNLPDEIDILADFKYVFGHGIMKVYWDEEKDQLGFDAIEPIFIVVPDGTKELQESEYLVHVKHLSKWDYRHGPDASEYNQDSDFVKKLASDPDAHTVNKESEYLSARRLSDGITHSSEKGVIILWEVFERTGKGEEILVHTCSPVCWQEEVRKSFQLSYRNAKIPFIDFPLERISKSFYSSRGIAELGAAFQGYLCKTWNAKSDHMDLWNNPPLTASKEIPMVGNIKSGPGVIIPFPVTPIQMGAPAISWDQEMANTRDLAEQLFAVPDFGIGEKGFDAGKKRSADKTATETQLIAATTNTMMDAQQRLDRRQLGKLYNQAWDILYQFDDDMAYLHDQAFLSLDKTLRDKVQSLRPSGTPGSWNITQRLQRSLMRLQTYMGNPYVNQGELIKMALEMDEPGLVDRLYQDPGEAQQDQAQKQMEEIPPLGEGFPIKINPVDDHFIHAQVVMEYLLEGAANNRPLADKGQRAIMGHLDAHVQAGRQVDARKMADLVKRFQTASQIAVGAPGPPVGPNGQALPAPQAPPSPPPPPPGTL
jgi:hypothetical protein